jgi:hypothetical protein
MGRGFLISSTNTCHLLTGTLERNVNKSILVLVMAIKEADFMEQEILLELSSRTLDLKRAMLSPLIHT